MSQQETIFDLGFGLEKTHVLLTGASGQIGFQVLQAFLTAGALVSALDIKDLPQGFSHESLFFAKADVSNENELAAAFQNAGLEFGHIDVCICLAGLDLSFIDHHNSLCDMSLEQWRKTLDVNLTGTFLTARTWMRQLKEHKASSNCSLILIGSEAGTFGVNGNADYSASKAAVQYGLLRSLVTDLPRISPGARVNAIAPGAVDTPQFRRECDQDAAMRWVESEATVALRKPVPMESIARMCLFLASSRYSGSITGQCLAVDCGKQGRVVCMPNGQLV